MMVMERSASATTSEVVQEPARPSQLPHDAALYQRRSSSSVTPTQATVTDHASTHSRKSSYATQPTPQTAVQQPQAAPHIHFQGTPTHNYGPAQGGNFSEQHQHGSQDGPHEEPPPSPRLQPKHGSMLSLNGSAANSPGRIKVRDLSHIQSFASEEVLARSRHPSRHSLRGRMNGGQQYEISSMPVGDIIEMVAGLLTKITTTNDRQHEHLHRNIPPSEGSPHLSQQASSVLAFHGKNVPSITIASYLNRIHKYCPTSYEVFLSLLVYFDRMTEMVNSGSVTKKAEGESLSRSQTSGIDAQAGGGERNLMGAQITSVPHTLSQEEAYDISHFFVVDSFNIHRLVMAGVTCASKFFSDVFYTNSRYAKVIDILVPNIFLILLETMLTDFLTRLVDFLFLNLIIWSYNFYF